jgi:cytochrome c
VRLATPRIHPSRFDKVRRCSGSSGGRPATWTASHYSAGFAKAAFVWDDARLDAWLANPQAIIPGAIQPKAETRVAIIAYLKELN